MRPTSILNEAGPSNLAVEVVEQTPEQIVTEKIERLKSNIEEHLKSLHDKSITLKLIRTRAEASGDVDMMIDFCKALSALIVKTDRVHSMLTKLLTQEAVAAEMPKLVELLEETDSRFENTMAWAEKFNVAGESKPKARRR